VTENGHEREERLRAEVEDAPTISVDEYRGVSRRSFLTAGAAVAGGILGFYGLQKGPEIDNIPDVTRRFHRLNERIWSARFRDAHLAPTFSAAESAILKVNGRIGIRSEIDLEAWTLEVQAPDGSVLGTHTLEDIVALPKHEMIIEHKCVEGWSQVTTWAGARFSDFQDWYPDYADTAYVSMETPGGDYYVGNDRATMDHRQTLLVYEMVGQPLDQEHGAPLRLATPLKYGIKQLKRIGVIRFTDDPPADYWAERGYDYYAAL
jgi:DMSO/TMAO reductase YedYZ molybdopterin-dependent catalytic subunit